MDAFRDLAACFDDSMEWSASPRGCALPKWAVDRLRSGPSVRLLAAGLAGFQGTVFRSSCRRAPVVCGLRWGRGGTWTAVDSDSTLSSASCLRPFVPNGSVEAACPDTPP